MPLTVGTAGHIDHGKTWLVRALTGKDTDRLPEERERGISIDLGYAPLDLPDGRRLSLIDVPGHERFVRNMVAGATGIDLFLLVDRRGRGSSAPDTRAPRDHPPARDRARRRGGDEGRRRRRGDARLRARRGARAGPGSRRDRGECQDRRRARRAPRCARPRGGACVSETQACRRGGGAALRRPRLLAARDRDGRDRDALVGDGRRGRRAPGRAGRARRPRPQRAGARPRRRAGGGGTAGGAGASGRRANRAAPRRRAARSRQPEAELQDRRRARRARADR